MPGHAPYSAGEKQLWADRAAMLDPAAYVFVNGVSAVCGPVPSGKQWYVLNSWGVLSSINFTITGSVTNASPVFTAAALTAAEAGHYVFGTGVAAGRLLLEAAAGSGRLSGNATATNTGSYQIFTTDYHRELRASDDEALPMPEGTTLTVCPFGGYVYVCKPELVIPSPYGTGTDQRYITDPKGLYHSRLALLRTLPLVGHDMTVAPASIPGTTTIKAFPATFDDAMLMHVVCQDGAWVGLNSPTLGSMNTMNEISDYHSLRFAQRVLVPFKRTTFPNFLLAGGSISGNAQMPFGTGYGGGSNPYAMQGGCKYVALPGGW